MSFWTKQLTNFFFVAKINSIKTSLSSSAKTNAFSVKVKTRVKKCNFKVHLLLRSGRRKGYFNRPNDLIVSPTWFSFFWRIDDQRLRPFDAKRTTFDVSHEGRRSFRQSNHRPMFRRSHAVLVSRREHFARF